MLTKILFTALVILAVYLFYRSGGRKASRSRKRPPPAAASTTGRFAAYGFVGLLVLVSAGIGLYQWHQAHQIVTIRVIDGNSNNVTVYKAYKKSIKDNRFESLDGKSVVLGQAERVEFIQGE